MSFSSIRRFFFVFAMLLVPVAGYAQEASIIGTVTDSSGGVVPGVTVTAVHEATGNTFEAVTDERGGYRLAVRVGDYRLTANLPGFTTVTLTGVKVLVGQQIVSNVQMVPSGLQESVTVTGEAPLLDTTQSDLGGNIDPRQMEELPVNGRNWVDLTMLAPGSRANAVNETPVVRNSNSAGTFQLNVDGQQITQTVAGDFGQPRFSRDAIAEFEFVSSRFDATQGRSAGLQVNAVTKSGTNAYTGTLSGYFRDDRFNAADFIQNRVLPYSNQQLSGTFGGPLRRDRLHFFGHYEYEREPATFTYSSPYAAFNVDQTGTRRETKSGGRLDYQLSPQNRLTFRANRYDNKIPYEPRVSGGATRHPSASESVHRHYDLAFGSLTQVLSNRAVNEVKVGYLQMWWFRNGVSGSTASIETPKGPGRGPLAITFTGYTVGQSNLPALNNPFVYSFRDDLSLSVTKAGRHDLKMGVEYLYMPFTITIAFDGFGNLDAQGGPVPANIQQLLPDWTNSSTWNVAALSSISRQYSLGIGNFTADTTRHDSAAWIQDDWSMSDNLTLNLGLRYDLQAGALAESTKLDPFMSGDRPHDTNNIAPRLGFSYGMNDRTVIRGGYGLFFGDINANAWAYINNRVNQIQVVVLNDGRPDFASNPFNGPAPTFQQALSLGLRRNISGLFNENMEIPFTHQASVGAQRQIGETMAVEADYVFMGGRKELGSRNINVTFNQATGANFPFTTIASRPYPNWGTVVMNFTEQRSNQHALQTSFTKRYGNRWQASGTYTLSWLRDDDLRAYSGLVPVPFAVAQDLGGEYGLAVTDQRHRAVFNGIWDAGLGFQLSGLYFYGSGERFSTNFGGDRRTLGSGGTGRLRVNGTIVPRNDLVGGSIHRVDARIQRRFSFGDRLSFDGIFEVFNLFNRENFGSYVTQESNARYGQPSDNINKAYQPRQLQLGFRVAF